MSEIETFSGHIIVQCQHCGKIANGKHNQAWENAEARLAEVTRQRDELLKACRSVVADYESSKGEVFGESVRLCEKAIATAPDPTTDTAEPTGIGSLQP
jgi:hypothetical protein